MQDNVFLPKYTYKSLIDVLLISLGLLVISIFGIWRHGLGLDNFISLSAFVLFCFWWMRDLVRRIVFNSSSFSVERFLLPTKIIDYTEISDIGFSKVQTQKGEISFSGISNTQELLLIFVDLIKQGKVEKEQLEMKIVVEDEIWNKSIVLTAFFSFPFCALVFYVWTFYDYWFSAIGVAVSCGLIIYIVGFIVQQTQKKRLEK